MCVTILKTIAFLLFNLFKQYFALSLMLCFFFQFLHFHSTIVRPSASFIIPLPTSKVISDQHLLSGVSFAQKPFIWQNEHTMPCVCGAAQLCGRGVGTAGGGEEWTETDGMKDEQRWRNGCMLK